ncbi:MAG: bifunctional nuclease family protein, partial [Gaiellaceae bacterium]
PEAVHGSRAFGSDHYHWSGAAMREMTLYGVSFEPIGKQPIVLLKTADDDKFLPIWIGHPEAAAILMKLQGATPPRPMTHDLLSDVVSELQGEITRVTVTELRENTFYARITIIQNGQEVEIDSRPSDAIALAVRCDAQIFATDDVIEESGIDFQAEDDEQPGLVTASSLADLDPAEFRKFLETVTVEEFASSLEELEDEEPDDEDEEEEEEEDEPA